MLDKYLKKPAPDVLLVLLATSDAKGRQGADRRATTADRVQAAQRAIAFRSGSRITSSTISSATITEGAVTLLQEAAGTELAQLKIELDKLVGFTGGDAINEAAVSAVVGVRPGETMGDLLDAVAQRDARRRSRCCRPSSSSRKSSGGHDRHGADRSDAWRIGWAQAARERGQSARLSSDLFNLLKETGAYSLALVGRVRRRRARVRRRCGRARAIDDALDALLEADMTLKTTRLSSDEQVLANLVLTSVRRGVAPSRGLIVSRCSRFARLTVDRVARVARRDRAGAVRHARAPAPTRCTPARDSSSRAETAPPDACWSTRWSPATHARHARVRRGALLARDARRDERRRRARLPPDRRRVSVVAAHGRRAAAARAARGRARRSSRRRRTHLERFLLENPRHPERGSRRAVMLVRLSFDQNDAQRGCIALGANAARGARVERRAAQSTRVSSPRCARTSTRQRAWRPTRRSATTRADTTTARRDSATRRPKRLRSAGGEVHAPGRGVHDARRGRRARQAARGDAASTRASSAPTRPFRVRIGHYETRAAATAAAKRAQGEEDRRVRHRDRRRRQDDAAASQHAADAAVPRDQGVATRTRSCFSGWASSTRCSTTTPKRRRACSGSRSRRATTAAPRRCRWPAFR